MKRILVPVDFTPSSINAVKYATEMATALNMKVTLLHVLELYQYTAWVQETEIITPVFPINDIPKMEEVAIEKLSLLVEEQKKTNDDLSIDYVLLKGSFVFELIAQTAQNDTEFIVLSSFNNHDFLGNTKSNMRVLYYESTCPIVIVPQNSHYVPIKNVLYATSLNSNDLSVLQDLTETLAPFSPNIKIVHILSHKPEFDDQLKFLGFQKLIENVLKYKKLKYNLIINKEIENAIKMNTEQDQDDLVVLIKENKRLLQSIFEHSHTQKLTRILQVPIILYSERIIQNIKAKN